MNQPRLGFAFLPQKLKMEEVHKYLEKTKEDFSEAEILVSTLQIKPGSADPKVKDNPAITFATACNKRQDLVARAFVLLTAARTLELDYLIFNTGMRRYDTEALKEFALEAIASGSNFDLILGKPPILKPDSSQERLKYLEEPKIRHRLLTDMLVNQYLSESLNIPFTNLNAGMFCIKTSVESLACLSAVKWYDDSSLVCSQIAWNLILNDFNIKSVPVKSINLDLLGFNLEKAIYEIDYVVKMVEKKIGGCKVSLRKSVVDLFNERLPHNRWLNSSDEEWMWQIVVPKLNDKGHDFKIWEKSAR